MKPYIFSEYLRQTKDVGWAQAGENVRYHRKPLTYDFLPELYDEEDYYTYNCLSFDYTFDVDWEEVHFAYTPPFSYSDLNDMLLRLKQAVAAQLAPAQESNSSPTQPFSPRRCSASRWPGSRSPSSPSPTRKSRTS